MQSYVHVFDYKLIWATVQFLFTYPGTNFSIMNLTLLSTSDIELSPDHLKVIITQALFWIFFLHQSYRISYY